MNLSFNFLIQVNLCQINHGKLCLMVTDNNIGG
uniref:Uncharacterized protein n=1 Tax=Rhizophora mucronata TaxID=61149 RepID=A0A2P2QM20_RHIMU